MTAITAALVKELRERTGAPMMKCKKFLTEANGDIEEAIKAMRKADPSAASKRDGKVAAEGRIVIAKSEDGKKAAVVDVNCETDFVGGGDDLKAFAERLAQAALAANTADVAQIMALEDAANAGQTFEQVRQEMIAKIGEKIELRRAEIVNADEILGVYQHGARIGVLVVGKGSEEAIKDAAMHIAASKPVVVRAEDMPQSLLDSEKEIYLAQAAESGKDPAIMEKMVEGRVKKFVKANCLMGQPFVKSPDQTVADYLKGADSDVVSFVRLEVGEGIEKKVENFADEVKAQVEASKA
jgi:elongation factor Ts